MPSHAKAREEGARAGPPLEFYRVAGFSVLHAFEETIFARVEEWYRLPTTYHDGPACTSTPRQCSHHARRGVGAAGAGSI
ncbi:MAG TPA: hypothetical protein VFD73_22165 [Gemmatimonadales bacterium]|nr:hypothetical protein [Gemmatimonadales bacterium]